MIRRRPPRRLIEHGRPTGLTASMASLVSPKFSISPSSTWRRARNPGPPRSWTSTRSSPLRANCSSFLSTNG